MNARVHLAARVEQAAAEAGGITALHRRTGICVIAITAQKGGVGKTTTAVQLALALAGPKRTVLLLDLDDQAAATGALVTEPWPVGMAEVLLDGRRLRDAAGAVAGAEGLYLGAGGSALEGADVALSNTQRLSEALLMDYGLWDVVLIDCPPTLGLRTVNALLAATGVLTPVTPAYLAQDAPKHLSLLRLRETVQRAKTANPTLVQHAYLLTQADLRAPVQLQDARTRLAEFAGDSLLGGAEIRVCRNVQADPATKRRCRGVDDYRAAARALARRFGIDAVKR